ncbi:MAG: DUF1266 domain-containing protein [Hungatella sp.]|jgi:hypothetical protein|nr:DUF1266 domain-containing protein [Hungatella sp.]
MNKQKFTKNAVLLSIIGVILCGCAGCVPQKEVQPEILWINGTYAVLTELNGGDYTLFGGMKANEAFYLAKGYDDYIKYGAGAIDGWDYCRAASLCGWYYIAGYYTEQEALDKSLEIAQTIQKRFSSWDEMMESYLRGYEYWAYESGDARREVYEDIKTRDNSPYLLDWNLPLAESK